MLEMTIYVLLDGTLAARQRHSDRVVTCPDWATMLPLIQTFPASVPLRVVALSPFAHPGGSI